MCNFFKRKKIWMPCQKNILKYKKDIKYIHKHECYYCQRLHLKYQICIVSKPYIEKLPNELNNENSLKDVIICKYCNNMKFWHWKTFWFSFTKSYYN